MHLFGHWSKVNGNKVSRPDLANPKRFEKNDLHPRLNMHGDMFNKTLQNGWKFGQVRLARVRYNVHWDGIPMSTMFMHGWKIWAWLANQKNPLMICLAVT